MAKYPKISLILSCYNEVSNLKTSIPSILNQTLSNFEFIIINDGSSDSSWDVIQSFAIKDERIIAVNQKNIGLTRSLNKGLEIAKGKYVARIDADDLSYKNRLEKQYEFLEKNKDIVLVGAQRLVINKINKIKTKDKLPISPEQIRKTAIKSNPFFHSLVMFRKDVIKNIGGYDESFKYVQDYELWSRIIHRYKTANLDKILGEKVIYSSAISFRNDISFERNICGLRARYRNYTKDSYPFYYLIYLAKPLYWVIKSIPFYFYKKFYAN